MITENKIMLYKAYSQFALVIILLVCQILGIVSISELSISEGLVKSLFLAALFTIIFSKFISQIILKIPTVKLPKLRAIAFYSGCLVTILGLIGFAIVRTSESLSPTDPAIVPTNFVIYCNVLFVLALTLGLPVLSGVIYEDAMSKRINAIAALKSVDQNSE